jgi:hypothetical protein
MEYTSGEDPATPVEHKSFDAVIEDLQQRIDTASTRTTRDEAQSALDEVRNARRDMGEWARRAAEEMEKRAEQSEDAIRSTIFKLSTGTLALSITFRQSIQAGASSNHLGWLVACWIFLTISTVAYTFLLTHNGHLQRLRALKLREMEKNIGVPGIVRPQYEGSPLLRNPALEGIFGIGAALSRSAQSVCFLGGVITLVTYAVKTTL